MTGYGDPLKKARVKHYGWWRQFNGFRSHPKWTVIASKLVVPQAFVTSVVGWLLEDANKGKPRGYVVDFSALECSATTGIDLDIVGRIYAALEEIGWIENEYLVTWDDRQKEKEDTTNAERQARLRKKRKLERSGSAVYAQAAADRNAVTAVTVTPKTQTQTNILSSPIRDAERVEAQQGLFNRSSGESGGNHAPTRELTQQEAQSFALLRLNSEGVAILRRCGHDQQHADSAIKAWLRMLDNGHVSNAVTLMGLFDAADHDGVVYAALPSHIERQVNEIYQRDHFGKQLPLMPRSSLKLTGTGNG